MSTDGMDAGGRAPKVGALGDVEAVVDEWNYFELFCDGYVDVIYGVATDEPLKDLE